MIGMLASAVLELSRAAMTIHAAARIAHPMPTSLPLRGRNTKVPGSVVGLPDFTPASWHGYGWSVVTDCEGAACSVRTTRRAQIYGGHTPKV